MLRYLKTSIALMLIVALSSLSSLSQAVQKQKDRDIQRAINWLISQRGSNYGWGSGIDTAQALIAIELTKSSSLLERKLSGKQLEIELILNLWYHSDTEMMPTDYDERLTVSNIALYSLALLSTCQDPRYFHGHDLIGSLLHHEAVSDLDFALSSLVTCKAGAHIRKRHIRRLVDIVETKRSIDILSNAILALHCVERDHRNRNVKPLLKEPLVTLASLQQQDGGFGSFHSTAVAMKALQEGKAIWNRTKSVSWLLNRQGPDGAFFDVPTTAEVILALTNVASKEDNCKKQINNYNAENEEAAIITPYNANNDRNSTIRINNNSTTADLSNNANVTALINNVGGNSNNADGSNNNNNNNNRSNNNYSNNDFIGNMTVTYSMWVGSNVTEKHTMNITVDHNATFYEVMQRAAEQDQRYQFAATEWPNGHYVHTLYGYKEEPMSFHYWLLYRLAKFPDTKNPPGNQLVAPTGVDDLLVQDGEHYLFWYKKL